MSVVWEMSVEKKNVLLKIKENLEEVLGKKSSLGKLLWHELLEQHPADIADFFAEIDRESMQNFFLEFPEELRFDVFQELSDTLKTYCLSFLSEQNQADVLHSLSIDDLTDLWNTPAEPPNITRGFVHNTEPGQYDSFIYRFGDWGRLAGAYDPSTDTLYALLATGQFSHEATAQLYLHLCFVVHPYSQECIDSYFEQGLADGTLADFEDVGHQAEWQIDEQTWRLDIEGNVLTIRVLGAAVS